MLPALILGGAAAPALADNACVDFKWDVTQERALFATAPAVLNSGKDPHAAPMIVPNRLYQLRLQRQDQVAFAMPPANKSAATAYAGLATLKIPSPGSYRIAVDLPLWMDVALKGTLVPAEDYEVQRSCGAPHKIVVFNLAGVQPFLLQFSHATDESIRLTVTASPPRKY